MIYDSQIPLGNINLERYNLEIIYYDKKHAVTFFKTIFYQNYVNSM